MKLQKIELEKNRTKFRMKTRRGVEARIYIFFKNLSTALASSSIDM
jgi:hypothetical protein